MATFTPVTDPTTLDQLNGANGMGEPPPVADPSILEQLNAPVAPPAPVKPAARDLLRSTLQQNKLFGSATSAMGQSVDKGIRRGADGNWDLPYLDQQSDSAVRNAIGGLRQTVAQKVGVRGDTSLPTAFGPDKQAIQNVFHRFQQDNNLSDDEVTTAWQDLGIQHRKWGEDEKTRRLSDDTIVLNPMAPEILDMASAHKIIDESGAGEESRARAKAVLGNLQTEAAGTKLEAYEAAANAVPEFMAQPGAAIGGQAGRYVGESAMVVPPSKWARDNGRDDIGTPEFVRDYERSVIHAQNPVAAFTRGIANDWIMGLTQLANTVTGVGGAVGSDRMAGLAAEGSAANAAIGQGKTDTGITGQIVQQIPSLAAQVVTGRLLGAAGALTGSEKAASAIATIGTFATAGAQSAGMQYADDRAAGKTHEQAQKNALNSGVSTALITAAMGGTGRFGGVEQVAAGKAVADVTIRDLFRTVSREEARQNLRVFAKDVLMATTGEAAEEGIDQLTQSFLVADPDTNLADAWDQAVQAGVVGGVLGGGVHVAAGAFEGSKELPLADTPQDEFTVEVIPAMAVANDLVMGAVDAPEAAAAAAQVARDAELAIANDLQQGPVDAEETVTETKPEEPPVSPTLAEVPVEMNPEPTLPNENTIRPEKTEGTGESNKITAQDTLPDGGLGRQGETKPNTPRRVDTQYDLGTSVDSANEVDAGTSPTKGPAVTPKAQKGMTQDEAMNAIPQLNLVSSKLDSMSLDERIAFRKTPEYQALIREEADAANKAEKDFYSGAVIENKRGRRLTLTGERNGLTDDFRAVTEEGKPFKLSPADMQEYTYTGEYDPKFSVKELGLPETDAEANQTPLSPPQPQPPADVPGVEPKSPEMVNPEVAAVDAPVVRDPSKPEQMTPEEWFGDNHIEDGAPSEAPMRHFRILESASDSHLPLNANAVEAYQKELGLDIPEGYTSQGDLYIFKPSQTDVPNPQGAPPAQTAETDQEPPPASENPPGDVAGGRPGDGGRSAAGETGGVTPGVRIEQEKDPESGEINYKAIIPEEMAKGMMGTAITYSTPRTPEGAYILSSGYYSTPKQAQDHLAWLLSHERNPFTHSSAEAHQAAIAKHNAAVEPIRRAIGGQFRPLIKAPLNAAIAEHQAKGIPAIWMDDEIITPKGKYRINQYGKLAKQQDLSKAGFEKNLDTIQGAGDEGNLWAANDLAKAEMKRIADEREAKRLAEKKAQDEKDASDKETARIRQEYDASVNAVVLPKGKKMDVTVSMGRDSNETRVESMTVVGPLGYRVNPDYSNKKTDSKYFVTHVASGLGLNGGSLLQSTDDVKRYLKALLHTGVDLTKKSLSEEETAKLFQAVRAYRGGPVPDSFKPSPAPEPEPPASPEPPATPEPPTPTPEPPASPPAPAPESPQVMPHSVEAIKTTFDLADDDQAIAADAVFRAMGIDPARLDYMRGGEPGVGALSQNTSEELTKYEDPGWDALTPEEQYDNLTNFVQRYTESKNPQGVGAPDVLVGTGARRIILQRAERGQSGLSDLRELVRTGEPLETSASLEGTTGVRVVIGHSPVLEALDSGDQMTAKRYLAGVVSEEIIHAAHLLAVRESLGGNATSAQVAKELRDTFDEAKQQLGDKAFRRAVLASIITYKGTKNPYEGLAFDEVLDRMGDYARASALLEMARQHVQTRREGRMTEEVRPAWFEKVRAWLGKTIEILRGYAANPEQFGPRYAGQIARMETLLDQWSGTSSQDARYLELTKDPEVNKDELQRMVDAAARAAGYNVGPVYHGTDTHETFTSFDPGRVGQNWRPELGAGFYFTPDFRFARQFGRAQTITGFLKIQNPLQWDTANGSQALDFMEGLKLSNRNAIPDKVKSLGHDGIITGDGQIVVFDPNQIKSAEPITRDADGNVIPLSERFNPASNSILYQYAGEKANLPARMKDSLEAAKAMAAAGKTSEEIRAVTGWFPGVDGKLRWEISDDRAKANPLVGVIGTNAMQVLRSGEPVSAPLGRLIDHPALFEAYPEMKNVAVFIHSTPLNNGNLGTYYPETNSIELAIDRSDVGFLSNAHMGTLLHEVQHAIQQVEGTAKGSMPSTFTGDMTKGRKAIADSLIDFNETLEPSGVEPISMEDMEMEDDAFQYLAEKFEEASPYLSEDEGDALVVAFDKLSAAMRAGLDTPQELYRRTAGEVEARDTQARRTLTPEQRAALAPYSSENIAPEEQIIMFQKTPLAPKAAFSIAQSGRMLVQGLTNPDFSSFVHEVLGHVTRATILSREVIEAKEAAGMLDPERDITLAELDTVEKWAGAKNGKWSVAAEEKFARGIERYFREGAAPNSVLAPIFKKIGEWMKAIYTTIAGSPIDVKISPEVRAVFDKLVTRNADEVYAKLPVEPLLPPVAPVPEIDPEEEPPAMKGTHAFGDAERERLGLKPRLPMPRNTHKDLWDQVIAIEDRWAADPTKNTTSGAQLLTNLLADPATAVTPAMHAQLVHEGLVRKNEVANAQEALNKVSADAAAGVRDAAKTRVTDALRAYDQLWDFLDATGTKAGQALQIRQMAVMQDFSLAELSRRALAMKNLAASTPQVLTEAEIQHYAKVAEELKQAQARLATLEANSSEQAKLIEELTQAVAKAQKDAKVRDPKKKPWIKQILDPKAEEAKKRLLAKDFEFLAQNNEMTPENLMDIATIGASWLVDKAYTPVEFMQKLVATFGQWIAQHADAIFNKANSLYTETAESVSGRSAPTPATIIQGIDGTKPLEHSDVWALARSFVIEGKRGDNVLDAVLEALLPTYPDLTREQVAQKFTKYGEVIAPPDRESLKGMLDRIRTVERIGLKIRDVRNNIAAKRTGPQRQETDVEIRNLEKQYRELDREFRIRAKELGIPVEDDANRLKSALGAAKRRMENELAELSNAIKTGKPRITGRSTVDYDAEATALKTKLDAKRAEYDAIFGQPDEAKQLAALLQHLDNQIAEETDLLAKDVPLAPKEKRKADPPEVAARREQLSELRSSRRALYEAVHPGETALMQAKASTLRSIERLQSILADTLPEAKVKTPVTPDAELQASLDLRDSLADEVKEYRKSLPLTPEQERAKVQRSLDASQRTLDALQAKLDANDLSGRAPKVQPHAAIRNARIAIQMLNKELNARRAAAKVGRWSDPQRLDRWFKAADIRKKELQRRRDTGDFTPKARTSAINDPLKRQVEYDIERIRHEVYEKMGREALKNAGFAAKAWHHIRSVLDLSKVLRLGGDAGMFQRQLGGGTMQYLVKDAAMLAKMLVPYTQMGARAREQYRAEGTKIGKTLAVGWNSAKRAAFENDYYRKVMVSPEAAFFKTMKMVFLSPFDTEVRNTEDIPRTRLLLDTPWYVWPVVAGGAWAITGAALPIGLLTIALSTVAKPTLIALERAQRAMSNHVRWDLAHSAIMAITDEHGVATNEDLASMGNAIMVGTGRGSLKSRLDATVGASNIIFLSSRYYLSRIQALALHPLWADSKVTGGSGKVSAKARQEVAKMYARSIMGRAFLYALAYVLLGRRDDKDSKDGIVLNPLSSDFGRLKVGGIKLDFMSGLASFASIASKIVMREKVDAKGRTVPLTAGGRADLRDEVARFLKGKMNLNLSLAVDTWSGSYFGGKPVTKETFTQQVLTPIIFNDTMQIFETLGPARGAVAWSLMFTGAGASMQFDPKAMQKYKAEARALRVKEARERALKERK